MVGTSIGQTLPIDPQTKKIVFTEIIKVDSVSKDELYSRAREWFARTFVSSKNVLEMDDRQAGKLIGNGAKSGFYYGLLMTPVDYTLTYEISVYIKDGRYKYEIADFVNDENKYGSFSLDELSIGNKLMNKKGEYRSTIKPFIEDVIKTGNRLSESLKAAMSLTSKELESKSDF